MIRAMMMILTVASVASMASARGTFNDVKRVLEDQDQSVLRDAQALSEFGVYQSGRLPQYAMNIQSVFQFGSTALENAAQRTINDKSDYLERLPKLLHPNGVCVVGTWEMNEGLPYTGAFAGGTKNLFIGRVSVAMQETTRGNGLRPPSPFRAPTFKINGREDGKTIPVDFPREPVLLYSQLSIIHSPTPGAPMKFEIVQTSSLRRL